MKLATIQIRKDFIRFLKPEMTLNGFRVNLVNFVRFVLFTVYKESSLVGVAIDIWGDGMLRAGKDITRLGFRVLKTPNSSYASQTVQQSSHVFTFCVFHGKDKRINLENNLGSSTIVGQRGFLFNQTKELHEPGALVTCSGYSPFILRMLSSSLSDSSTSHSKLELFIADP